MIIMNSIYPFISSNFDPMDIDVDDWLEKELLQWLSDPLASGNKEEGARRIREFAATINLDQLGVTSLPLAVWQSSFNLTDQEIDKFKTVIFEIGLQRWLADPNVTGNKEEAVRRLRECKLDLNGLELNSLPSIMWQTTVDEHNLSEQEQITLQNFAFEVELERWFRDPDVTGDKEEAVRRIKEARNTLNLDELMLNKLPVVIGQMKELKSLSVSRNQLTSLPPLPNLEELNLSYNAFQSVPPEAKQIPKVSIDHNNLSEEELNEFEMQKWLSDPSAVGNKEEAAHRIKEAVERLNLDGLGLNKLPSLIGRIKGLKSLSAAHNQLTTLPREIGELHNLQELDLASNPLEILPPEIWQLAELKPLPLLKALNHKVTIVDRQLFREGGYGYIYQVNEIALNAIQRVKVDLVMKVPKAERGTAAAIRSEIAFIHELHNRLTPEEGKKVFPDVQDVIFQRNNCYLMEGFEGNLVDLLLNDPPSLEQKVEIAGQLIEQMALFSKNKVIYTDIKPENVLYRDHQAFFSDFGSCTFVVKGRPIKGIRTGMFTCKNDHYLDDIDDLCKHQARGLGLLLCMLISGKGVPFNKEYTFDQLSNYFYQNNPLQIMHGHSLYRTIEGMLGLGSGPQLTPVQAWEEFNKNRGTYVF